MARQTSSAGPFSFELPSAIGVGETAELNTRTLLGGPRNKRGGLKKFYGQRGGFDFVVIANTTDEIIEVEANGGVSDVVPPATNKTLTGNDADDGSIAESTVFTVVRVTNTGTITAASIDADRVRVSFGNSVRPEEGRGSGIAFDPVALVPGFRSG